MLLVKNHNRATTPFFARFLQKMNRTLLLEPIDRTTTRRMVVRDKTKRTSALKIAIVVFLPNLRAFFFPLRSQGALLIFLLEHIY